ncbi:MAG: iron-containing alcohol dehydrogenase [Oscillospiraceae bacterium]
MNEFSFWMPTKVVFGTGTPDRTGEEVRAFQGSKVLVLYGGGSAVKSGLLKRVTNSLDREGLAWKAVGGVQPNPLAEFAQKIVDEHRDQGFDFLLAVGGGSVIDTAKAVSYGLSDPETPIWDYFSKKAVPSRNLPVGVVLTIAAAGSETSDSAVLTLESEHLKRGLGTPLNRPKFAIMDPAVTVSLPPRQTACGITDIMMHTLDRYFAQGTGNDVTDGIARAVLRTAIRSGAAAMADPGDVKARSELMWAGSISHNGMTGLGQGRDFSVHQLGHELSGMFDIPHGESLSAMWPAWARYVMETDVPRFAHYAREIWDIAEADDRKAAVQGIDATENYFRSLGMPITLGQAVGVQPEETLKALAHKCSFGGTRTIGSLRPLGEEEIYQVYKKSNH